MKRAFGAELIALQARVGRWRKHRESGRSRIPQELWDQAVVVAGIEGIHATAKALRFNYDDVKKRFERAQADHGPAGCGLAAVSDRAVDEASQATFVQLQMPSPDGQQRDSRVVIEFTGREGDRMRIDAAPGAGINVVGMVQAFWSRAS